jgi:hypothetical protein
VLETERHAREILLGQTDDSLVDVAEYRFLNTVVLNHFTEHTAVAAANDQDALGIRVRVHGEVSDHLLVSTPG